MFSLNKIYTIWFVLFLGSCFQTANFPVEFIIFKSEISNYKQLIAISKSPYCCLPCSNEK